MGLLIATYGGITIDNVVNAEGEVGLRFPGGNGIYSAAGAWLWERRSEANGLIPENYPQVWLDNLQKAGIGTGGIKKISGFVQEQFEWFFYESGGDRQDMLYARFSDLERAQLDLPAGLKQQFKPSREQLELIKQSVKDASVSAGRPASLRPSPAEEVSRVLPLLLRADGVHVAPSSYPMQLALAESLSRAGKLVSLDPGHYMGQIDHHQLAALLSKVAIFMPSEREVEELLGTADHQDAARFFASLGSRVIVVKRGTRGSLIYDAAKGEFQEIQIYPTHVADPTGCGDAFCGGFLAGYVSTRNLRTSAIYGTVAASFVIEGFGADLVLAADHGIAAARALRLEQGHL